MLFAWFMNVSGSASIEIIISAHGRFCDIDASNGPKVFNSLANILEITQEKLCVLSVNRFHLSKFSKQHLFLNFVIFCSNPMSSEGLAKLALRRWCDWSAAAIAGCRRSYRPVKCCQAMFLVELNIQP